MVHGYHVVIAAYGFWLPNDPRGSWSEVVRKWELLRYGECTRNVARRGLASLTPQEINQRDLARRNLQYPAVTLNDQQIQVVAGGIATQVLKSNYTVWACSILPEHVHLVIARHTYKVEQVVNLLKGAMTRALVDHNSHPLAAFCKPGERPPRMWAEHEWRVFLDSEEEIEEAMDYVQQNPIKESRPAQCWPFVKPFSGLEPGWITYH